MTCDFLYCCTGYYRYDEPYAPRFEGAERFSGHIVHPQHWPDDLDLTGRRVIVIGSGATAVTLVPALAETAERVTMLQRSPSYILSVPGRDPLVDRLRRRLSAERTYSIVKWRNVLLTMLNFELCQRAPRLMRKLIRGLAVKQLPPGFDVDTHLNPTYKPWDQRLCLVPDGDLFQAVSGGRAEIVTDEVEALTAGGIKLRSGRELEADVIVAATGLNLLLLGGLEIEVDGAKVDMAGTVAYKGMMLSGIPNLALTLGYTNASWTLKADLVAEYVCRLLRHMDTQGTPICVPAAPDPSLPRAPIIGLKSGYVRRSMDVLPKQGPRPPWRLHQNYIRDIRLLRHGPIEDDGVEFRRPAGSHPKHAVPEFA
jgi:cation diffusion facilitator CzcD-associated flavoprotein CzcO